MAMDKKKTIIICAIAFVVCTGIGIIIPVLSNANYKISSYEEAKKILGEGIEGEASTLEQVVAENETDEKSVDNTSNEIEENQNDENNHEEKEAEQVTVTEKTVIKDGAVIFDFDPDQITFLGRPITKNIVSELYEEYDFPEGVERATKEYDDRYEISAYTVTSTDFDGNESTDGIGFQIHSSDYNKSIQINTNNRDNKNAVEIYFYSNNQSYDEDYIEFINEFSNLPFIVGDEDDVEKVFHISEIKELSEYKEATGIPFESNFEGSNISKYVWSDDESEHTSYNIVLENLTLNVYENSSTNGLYTAGYSFDF